MAPNQIPIWAGILVGVVSSLIQSLGLTIQRKSHILNEAEPLERQKVDYKRPLWLFGFSIFISTNFLGSVFQIASLPVVILAPLGAISLLWNAVFARLLLSDPFTLSMSLATLLVGAGAVLIGVFGVLPTPTHSLDALIALFARPAFIAYFTVVLSGTMGLLVVTHIVEWRYRAGLRAEQAALAREAEPEREALLIAEPTERTPFITIPSRPPSASDAPSPIQGTRLFLALSYAVLSGTLSGFGLLFAKAGVELVVLTLGGDNQFWRWQAWVLVPGLAFFGLSQLWYLHKSLTFADPTLICPLAFCLFNISSILDSLIYFDQFRFLSPLQLSMILLGTFLLLTGVWLLSLQSAKGVQMGTGVAGAFEAEAAVMAESPTSYGPGESAEHGFTGHTHHHHAAMVPASTWPRSPSHHAGAGAGGDADADADVDTPPMSPRARFRSLLSPARPAPGESGAGTTRLGGGMPGFSIGLSPTSPGFVLSPPRRRRTLAGGSSGGGSGFVGGGGERERERERDTAAAAAAEEGSRAAGAVGGGGGGAGEGAGADVEGSEAGEIVHEKRGWWGLSRWGWGGGRGGKK